MRMADFGRAELARTGCLSVCLSRGEGEGMKEGRGAEGEKKG